MSLFSDIPLRTNGQKILRAWFNDIRLAGITAQENADTYQKYTVTYAQLQTAALTNDIEIFSLPIKAIITGVIVKHSTAFAGTSITDVKIDIGISGQLDRWISQFDVDSAVSGTNFDNQSFAPDIQSFSAVTSIRIKATAVGANLSALTQGSIDIWVKKVTLP